MDEGARGKGERGGVGGTGRHSGSGGVAEKPSTLLALAEVPAAANVAGPPLPGAPPPVAPAVDYMPHYTPATVVAATESAARSKVDQETVDKLRALGYIGATGGGVWKTTDGGANWRPVSDRFFKSSSGGAIAVPSEAAAPAGTSRAAPGPR